MGKIRDIVFAMCIIWGIAWSIVLCVIAAIIKYKTNFNLNDILFVEGIAAIAIGLLSSIGGNPMGVSIKSLGQNNAQYAANANLEISKMEKEMFHDSIKSDIKIALSTASLCLGGVICIIINFVI